MVKLIEFPKTIYTDMQNFEFGVDINCKLSFTCDFRGCYSGMFYEVINTLIIHVLLAGTSEWRCIASGPVDEACFAWSTKKSHLEFNYLTHSESQVPAQGVALYIDYFFFFICILRSVSQNGQRFSKSYNNFSWFNKNMERTVYIRDIYDCCSILLCCPKSYNKNCLFLWIALAVECWYRSAALNFIASRFIEWIAYF